MRSIIEINNSATAIRDSGSEVVDLLVRASMSGKAASR
jgi:hypothetical protein